MNELKRKVDLPIPFSIVKAHAFALERHKGQKRKGTGEPYIHHPERVVYILSLYMEDTDILTAAMLHDIVEDTHATQQDIYSVFGDKIGSLVEELTIDPYASKILGKKMYLSNSVNTMTSDAFTIKLADRLDNVISLIDDRLDIDFVRWYHKETSFIMNNLNRPYFYDEVQTKLIDLIIFNLDYLEALKRL